jgi:alkylated DNA repair dioxygenase AlkB
MSCRCKLGSKSKTPGQQCDNPAKYGMFCGVHKNCKDVMPDSSTSVPPASSLVPVTVIKVKPVKPVKLIKPAKDIPSVPSVPSVHSSISILPTISNGKPDGLIYIRNFLDTDVHDEILHALDDDNRSGINWKTAGARAVRQVKHYGYNYPYTRALVLTKADDIPEYMYPLIDKLNSILPDFMPDQAIVNRYLTGEGIGAHIDHPELFGDTVVSMSFGCGCTMKFVEEGTGKTYEQKVEPGSVYAMTGPSRSNWTHEMVKSKRQCSTRYSITFRTVNQRYVKS